MSSITSALLYAASGKPVFPCGTDKKPLTAHGFKDASTDPGQITSWWEKYPMALIGMPTGAISGCFVIDADIDPERGIDGNETLSALDPLPPTVETMTPRGGRHLYFQYPGYHVPCSAGVIGRGVDVRGDGGYVIVPPSTLPDGRCYEWEGSSNPDEGVEIAEAPAWLLNVVTARTASTPGGRDATEESFSEGFRNSRLFSLGRSLRAKGMTTSGIRAALQAENMERCVPPLSLEEVDTVAESACTKPATVHTAATELDRRMSALKTFNDTHGIVAVNGKAVVVSRGADANTGKPTTRYSSMADALLFHAPETVLKQKKIMDTVYWKHVEIFPEWRAWDGRRTYKQLMFQPIPGLVSNGYTLPDTENLNLYQGLTVTPKAGKYDLIAAHILNIWCAGDAVAFEYVMCWLARMFQFPHERGHTVLALKSAEGTGKNIIVDMLVEAFGEHACVVVDPEGLVGRFNDHLATSVLVFANEAIWGGDRKLEGKVKSLITDELISVERKYMPRVHFRNCVHLIMASNSEWIAPIGIGDRRFVVLDVSNERKGDHPYFRALRKEISTGGAEAFIYELLNMDLTGFDPRKLPKLVSSNAKDSAKLKGADSVVVWWNDCMSLECITITEIGSQGTRTEVDVSKGWADSLMISTKDLYASYHEWAQRQRIQRPANAVHFGKGMVSMLGLNSQRYRLGDGTLAYGYDIPQVEECRRLFAEMLG